MRTRSAAWARRCAAALAASAVTPNQISVASVLFACLGAAALLAVPGPAGLFACAAGVQLRLLCNLLDGMVAIEGGKRSPLGGLYNELPDRVADAVLLVALGYAVAVPWLGWLCALLAVLTAYIRAFGAGAGLAHDFSGPMAKPHRMAAMTAGCLAGAFEVALHGSRHSLLIAAGVIAAGTALTCVRRTATLAARLQSR